MTFEQESRAMFLKSLEHLNKFVAIDAPDSIVAAAIAHLLRRAEGFCGEFIQTELLRYRLNDLRRGLAYCQHCDNQVSVERCHAPICEHCDAKFKTEFEVIDE